jgi:hypothetical protein
VISPRRSIAIGAAVAALSASTANAAFVRAPYLQDLGPKQVAVLFEMDAAHAATIELTKGEVTKGAEGATAKVATSPRETTHEIVIDGLEPATSYSYSVKLDDGTTERGTFTTAPDDARPFTFIAYGDNRTNPYAHAAIVAAIKRTPADLLLHTGDMVYDGSQPADWREFFSIERELLRDRCVFPTIGNHEIAMPTSDGALRYARMFRVPAPPDAAERWYTFRWSSTRFFMLDAHDEFASAERAWLEKSLESAKNEAGVQLRIVVLHHGPYSSGLHGGNEALILARVPDLLRSYKVDLVLSGHDHVYERGDANGLRYIVSGGGGAPVYREYRAAKTTLKFEPVYHFLKFAVNGGAVNMSALRHDGSIIETCSLSPAAGWGCGVTPPNAASVAVAQKTPVTPVEPPPPRRSCGCTLVSGGSEWVGLVVGGVLAGAAALRPRRRRKDESFRK